MSTYHSGTECDVVLRDGSTLHLRPVRPSDAAALIDLYGRLSTESLYFRYFSMPKLDAERIAKLAAADLDREFTLVGECGGRLEAVASYARDPQLPAHAEVAFTIADALQGRGVGTRMLERLAEAAREAGVAEFHAYVMGENRRMMQVFLDSGFEVRQRIEEGIFHVVLSLEETAALRARSAARAQQAAAASMRAFFAPRVVAVVGANRERGRIGSEIFVNILDGEFRGRVVPVNPSTGSVVGVTAYPTVGSIPGDVDLAVIVVPAPRVSDVVDDCIAKGVRALVVITAGFAETGTAGREREAELVEKIRRAGIRMIGPNCMGIINTDPHVRLNATFSPVNPIEGRVGFSTQSGALGLAILEHARQLNFGISTFVSVGNKADVSGNDLLQYWEEDPRTDVILLYLESFGNPRKFSQIARRVGRKKPIVAVKAGRSGAGARAASSHTGALASSDAVVDALCRQSGVVRIGTLEEMFDVATLLANQPVPAGPRVAILTNAGGPGILAADACEAAGLELPTLENATIAELRSFLPAAASVANPVDMIASASEEDYRHAMRALLADSRVDSLLVLFIPPVVTLPERAAAAIVEGAKEAGGKPVLASFLGTHGAPRMLAPVPSYAFPESAARALARVTAYGRWRTSPEGTCRSFADVRRADARGVVDGALARGGGWLTPLEAQALVEAFGIPAAAASQAGSEEEASQAAARLGFPVALKAVGPSILHKTEEGGVKLDLADESAVRRAHANLRARLGDRLVSVLVQRMIPRGVELVVGGVLDPTFGPLVMCGSGGTLLELLGDVVFRLHPLTDADAAAMIDEMRGAPLLRGFRGAPAADEAALGETLLRVSALLDICPEVHEMDINPLKVLDKGVCAVDVRIRVDERPAPPVSRRIAY
jgi:acetyl coenzyme A synthetase (ADP forming)-like protein